MSFWPRKEKKEEPDMGNTLTTTQMNCDTDCNTPKNNTVTIVQSPNNCYVNAHDIGVKPDGSDQSSRFQNWINLNKNTPTTVVFPPGDYLFNDGFTLSGELGVEGCGRTKILLPNHGRGITLGGSTLGRSANVLKKLHLYGSATTFIEDHWAVKVSDQLRGCIIDDIRIERFGQWGMYFGGSISAASVSNIDMRLIYDTGLIMRRDNFSTNASTFTNISGIGVVNGIDIDQSHFNTFIGGTFTDDSWPPGSPRNEGFAMKVTNSSGNTFYNPYIEVIKNTTTPLIIFENDRYSRIHDGIISCQNTTAATGSVFDFAVGNQFTKVDGTRVIAKQRSLYNIPASVGNKLIRFHVVTNTGTATGVDGGVGTINDIVYI